MMDKDKLRKADIFSGGLIFLIGTFIVSQAVQMPMKDSWGGVQNVWYVSPAIFPLFIGAMIMLLGGLLVRTAIKEVGIKAVKEVSSFVFSPDFIHFLKLEKNIRFYATVTILVSFVFLFTPRVDFFLTAIEFLLVFICMFHLQDTALLIKLYWFYVAQILIFFIFLVTGLSSYISSYTAYPGDWLVLCFILTYAVFAFRLCSRSDLYRKKFKTSLIVAVASPLIIGMIFKYFLLVPMPFEGIVVELMDAIWYYEF